MAPPASFPPPATAVAAIRHSHLDSASYRSLVRIFSACLDLATTSSAAPHNPPTPLLNPSDEAAGNGSAVKDGVSGGSEPHGVPKRRIPNSGEVANGVRASEVPPPVVESRSEIQVESREVRVSKEFEDSGCGGGESTVKDGISGGFEVSVSLNPNPGEVADGAHASEVPQPMEESRNVVQREEGGEVQILKEFVDVERGDGESVVKDGVPGGFVLSDVSECLNPNPGEVADGVRASEVLHPVEELRDEIQRDEVREVQIFMDFEDAVCGDGDFPEDMISEFADELIGLVQGSENAGDVLLASHGFPVSKDDVLVPMEESQGKNEVQDDGFTIQIDGNMEISESQGKSEVQDNGITIQIDGNMEISFSPIEVHCSPEEPQPRRSLEVMLLENPRTTVAPVDELLDSSEKVDGSIEDESSLASLPSMGPSSSFPRTAEGSVGIGGVLDDEDVEEGEIPGDAEDSNICPDSEEQAAAVKSSSLDKVIQEYHDANKGECKITPATSSGGKGFGPREDEFNVTHDRFYGLKCSYSGVGVKEFRNLKSSGGIDNAHDLSLPGKVPKNQVSDCDESGQDEEDDQDDQKHKKKTRGSMSEKRKAKKKISKKRKRAEKEREQGVKRLKLQIVLKPKKVISCKYYLHGKCDKGDQCKFAHDCTPLTKSKACAYFAKGECLKGDDCAYDHELSKYPCHNYMEKGSCIRGDECKFSHKISTAVGNSLASVVSAASPLPIRRSTCVTKANAKDNSAKSNVLHKASTAPFSIYNAMKEDLVESCLKHAGKAPGGVRFPSFGKGGPSNGASKQQVVVNQKIRNETAAVDQQNTENLVISQADPSSVSLSSPLTTAKCNPPHGQHKTDSTYLANPSTSKDLMNVGAANSKPTSIPCSTKLKSDLTEAEKILNEFLLQGLNI